MIVMKKSQVFKNSQLVFFSGVSAKMISKAGLENFPEYIPETGLGTIRKNYGNIWYHSWRRPDGLKRRSERAGRRLPCAQCLCLRDGPGYWLPKGEHQK